MTVKSLATTVEDWEALLEKVESDFMDGRNKKKLSQYLTNPVKPASVVKESNDLYHDETISEQGEEAGGNKAVVNEGGPLSGEEATASDLESDTQSEKTGGEQKDQSDGEHEDETGSEQQDQLGIGKENEKRSRQESRRERKREKKTRM